MDDEQIKKLSNNSEVIKFIQAQFKRLAKDETKILIRFILEKKLYLPVEELTKTKSFYRFNMSKFYKNKTLKLKEIIFLQYQLEGFLKYIKRFNA